MSLFPDPLPDSLPRPFAGDEAQLGFERWQDKLSSLGGESDLVTQVTAAAEPRRLLTAIFSQSPFLTDCVLKEPKLFAHLIQQGPDAVFKGQMEELARRPEDEERTGIMRRLRLIRRRAAMIIALSDLTSRWNLDQVTGALSDLACGLLEAALTHLLLEGAARKELQLADPGRPLENCGYVGLAMGKLGARELNFSSDIDLIVLFDPTRLPVTERRGPDEMAQRITRDLVLLLSERTADGYGFRVDLRLRPDPGAMPLAVRINAALSYYESLGQNWERAAMIKARPAVGDLPMGWSFLGEIRPFTWRRSPDFLAIQDIHAIKRQIYAAKGGSVVAIEGHNVKLGRGGIREIEFYAQTQQLIWGGRLPHLRKNRTVDALTALAQEGLIEPQVALDLGESYAFLRRVEHRLQMVADKQTHSLPSDKTGIARLAAFLGYPDAAALRKDLLFHLHRVEDHYAHLFEEDDAEAHPLGNLVFTGEPEPGTAETLTKLGFADPERVFNLIRSWQHGRYRATRSTAAREYLTLLMPSLLQALGNSADPDAAIAGFDAFLGGLPTGMQIFASLRANPQMLELLAGIFGSAPALGQHLARRPALIDAMLSPDFFQPLPKRGALTKEVEQQLASARSYEEELDLVRHSVHDRRFQAGVQMLLGLATEGALARRLSDLADALIQILLKRVQVEFARRHGLVPGGRFAVVTLGKLGGREMTFTSDLDLVFLYDVPEGVVGSDGEKSLDPTSYYTRYAQRLISAITAPTAEGRLYEIDMRLRMAGDAGPLVATLKSFRRYHAKEAWVWEHMALTRARVLSLDPAFRNEVAETIRDVICAKRDPDHLLREVASMHARIRREKPSSGTWDLKLRSGGLLDCEFLAQYWQLAVAHRHPAVVGRTTDGTFLALGQEGIQDQDEMEELAGSVHFLKHLQEYVRLTLGDSQLAADVGNAPEAIRAGIARSCSALDFSWLQHALEEVAGMVADCFEQHIAGPAGRLPKLDSENRGEKRNDDRDR